MGWVRSWAFAGPMWAPSCRASHVCLGTSVVTLGFRVQRPETTLRLVPGPGSSYIPHPQVP